MRRGRAPSELSGVHAAALEEYVEALAAAPLAQQTRRTYASKVRQYLAWLAGADADGEPLLSAAGRDWAVRDYRTHLQAVLKRTPATVNNALAAVDDLYIRRGLGSADAKRLEIPAAAPRALDQRAQIRYLRAVQASSSPRDRALALVPFYAGARISGTGRARRRRPATVGSPGDSADLRQGRAGPRGPDPPEAARGARELA